MVSGIEPRCKNKFVTLFVKQGLLQAYCFKQIHT